MPRLLNAVLVSAVIATALSGVGASTALGFGTVSSLNLHFHGQDREHERITRAALGCRAAWSIADPCFESIALDQLAGPDRDGLLMQSRGTVGEPDIRSFGDEKLHCDNADVRRVRAGAADDAPFRPYRDMDADHARAAASATLRICIELMRAHLDEGVTAAEHMIEDGHLKPGALADDYDDCFDGVFFALAFPKRKCTALLGLGQALHTAQDFYSHSNWSDSTERAPKEGSYSAPGLGQTAPADILDPRIVLPDPLLPGAFAALTTGCVHIVDEAPFVNICLGRVTHDELNKDLGPILADGRAGDGLTPRGARKDNFARAVAVAIADTRDKWRYFQEQIRNGRSAAEADLIICGLTRNDPIRSCDFSIASGGRLPGATRGAAYDVGLTAVGTEHAESWSVTGGSLPDGLALGSADGRISGKPTAETSASFTIRATGDDGGTADKDFELSVGAAPPQEIAFSSDRPPTGRNQVWRMEVDPPAAPVAVTSAGSGAQESRRPDWSGSRIAYDFGASGVRGVHMIEPSGDDDVRLTFGSLEERDPSWSPDRQFIVYSAQPPSAFDLRVHKVGDPTTPDDDEDYVLLSATGLETRPAWSPDGRKVAFVSSGGPGGSDAEIAVIDVTESGGRVDAVPGSFTLLTQNTFVDFDPTWSPDSASVAYSSTRSGNRDIYRAAVCGGAGGCESGPSFRALTSAPADDTNPAWSADGKRIAFVSQRDGNREIYAMSADAGEADSDELVRLTSDPASDDDPTWGPAPDRLRIVDQPATPATVGRPFAIQPTIAVTDVGGDTDASDQSTVVTLSAGGDAPGTLSCDGGLSRRVVDGLARFSGCRVDGDGSYSLRASADDFVATDLDELEAQPGSLAFATAPPEAVPLGFPFAAQPVVVAQDATGVTDLHDDSTVVTISASDGSAGALACDALSKPVSGGSAAFDGCHVDAAGTYEIEATAPGRKATSAFVSAASIALLSAPTLDAIDPEHGPAGGPATALHATGSNFSPSSVVEWNGDARPTTFVDATRLDAAIPAADFLSAEDIATASVTVRNPAPGGQSEPLPFTITGPSVLRSESAIVAAGDDASASTAPTSAGEAGVTATLGNVTEGDESATLTAATYATNPTPGTVFDVGGGFTDVKVTGAGPDAFLDASFYYPSSVTGVEESAARLLYWTGGSWEPVRSNGPSTPNKNTTDDLDGTVSGGRYRVVLDATSLPRLSDLSGTVFTVAQDEPAPMVSIADATVAEADAGATDATLTVSLSAPSSRDVSIDFRTADGSAMSPADYAATTGRVSFPAGETAETITVPVAGDTLDEPDETFEVDLANAVNATIGDPTGIVTIIDDDPPPNRAPVAADDAASTDEDTMLSLPVAQLLTNDTDPDGDTLTVSAVTATADSHGDVGLVAGTVTYAPDPDFNGPASFAYTLSDGRGETDTATVAITVRAVADPGISAADVRVAEGAAGTTSASVTLSLTRPADHAATVRYTTIDETAAAGSDYAATAGSLTIPAGASHATLSVPVFGDSADESDEAFTVHLSDPSQVELLDADAEVTIVDDDELPVPRRGSMSGAGTVLGAAAAGLHQERVSNAYLAGLDCSASAVRLTFDGVIVRSRPLWSILRAPLFAAHLYSVRRVTASTCFDDPRIASAAGGFDTITGAGSGTFGGRAATFSWTLTDGPGSTGCRSGDRTALTIRTAGETVSVAGCVVGPGNVARPAR